MKRKTPRAFTALRILTVSFVSGFAIPTLMAQIAPSAKPVDKAAEEAVVLSPFVISTDADDGYAATESASASRFKQKLKDIPQSIAIMSGQFLKDIGAVDLADVIPLVGGTVSGGTRGQGWRGASG